MSEYARLARHGIERPKRSSNRKEQAMQYALLFYQSPDEFAARRDPKKQEAFWASFIPYMKALHDAGIVISGAGLEPPDVATSIRLNGGKRQVQDGPFAEAKEQLGGFFIIDVANLDVALEWAARWPAELIACIEVRPVVPPTDNERMLIAAAGASAAETRVAQ
jgi:hypothetical protein